MAAPKPKNGAIEVNGIAVTVAIDPNDDYEFAVCSLVLNDPAASVTERSRALARMHRLVLGEAYQDVIDALRERNGGRLPVSEVTAFVNKAIAAGGGEAKN